MSALPLRTLCLCVKLSRFPLSSCRLSAVGCEPLPPLSPLPATPTRHLQFTENKATLSPFRVTLRSPVKGKSFVCHSCKKQGAVGESLPFFARHSPRATSATRGNAHNSNPLIRLLHNSRTPGVGGCPPPSTHKFRFQPSAFNFQPSTLSTSHRSPVTSHLP
jgi:hypothetical protein